MRPSADRLWKVFLPRKRQTGPLVDVRGHSLRIKNRLLIHIVGVGDHRYGDRRWSSVVCPATTVASPSRPTMTDTRRNWGIITHLWPKFLREAAYVKAVGIKPQSHMGNEITPLAAATYRVW